MSDLPPDLTPPHDEPMPDQSRARIRAELLEAAQAGPPARRWLIPAGVAAAVVLVAAMAAWAVQAGPDDSSGAPAAATSVAASPTPEDSPPPTPEDSPSPTLELSPSPPPEGQQAGGGDCRQELTHPLPGAELAAAFDDELTSFWVKGDRFALCDQRDRTTIQHPEPLSPVDRVETYAVSSVYTASGDVTRVAGGVVPDGAMAFGVEYTFPDGETVPAETVTGGGHTWWRVVHSYSSPGNEMKQPPIRVTVSYSGVQKTYELRWGLDTCAQANHGC